MLITWLKSIFPTLFIVVKKTPTTIYTTERYIKMLCPTTILYSNLDENWIAENGYGQYVFLDDDKFDSKGESKYNFPIP